MQPQNFVSNFSGNFNMIDSYFFGYVNRVQDNRADYTNNAQKYSISYTDVQGNQSTFGGDGDTSLENHGLPQLGFDQIAQAAKVDEGWNRIETRGPTGVQKFLSSVAGSAGAIDPFGVQLQHQGVDLTYSITARLTTDQDSKFKNLIISLFDVASNTQTSLTPGSNQTFHQNDKIGFYLVRTRIIMALKDRNLLVSHTPSTQNNTSTITSSQSWNAGIFGTDPTGGYSTTNSKSFTIQDFAFKDRSDLQKGVLIHDLFLTSPFFYTDPTSPLGYGALLGTPPSLSTSTFDLPSQACWKIPYDSEEESLSILIGAEFAYVEGYKTIATQYTEQRLSLFWFIDHKITGLSDGQSV